MCGERAYYLWEDDKKDGREILSDRDYYLLSVNITTRLYYDKIFKDITDHDRYTECNICMNYTAKLGCNQCNNLICGRCLIKLDKCSFCMFQGNRANKKQKQRTTYSQEQFLNLNRRYPSNNNMRYGERLENDAIHHYLRQMELGRRTDVNIPEDDLRNESGLWIQQRNNNITASGIIDHYSFIPEEIEYVYPRNESFIQEDSE